MTKKFIYALLFVSIAASGINAQSIFEKLKGNWKGAGTVNRMESNLTMKWETLFGDKFYRLSFKNVMKGSKGDVVFEGMAVYKSTASASETEGNWYDSFGYIRPIKAVIDKDSLISNWGTKDTEEGKTAYRLLEADKLEVVDSVKMKDGNWREFGRSNYTRVKE